MGGRQRLLRSEGAGSPFHFSIVCFLFFWRRGGRTTLSLVKLFPSLPRRLPPSLYCPGMFSPLLLCRTVPRDTRRSLSPPPPTRPDPVFPVSGCSTLRYPAILVPHPKSLPKSLPVRCVTLSRASVSQALPCVVAEGNGTRWMCRSGGFICFRWSVLISCRCCCYCCCYCCCCWSRWWSVNAAPSRPRAL